MIKNNISNLFRKIIYSIGLFILVIIFIRLVQFNSLLNLSAYFYYKYYFILSFLLIACGFISNYISQNFFEKLFIIIFSLFISLYFIESFISINEIFNRGEDKRSIIKVYKDMIKKNKNVSVSIPPYAYLFKHYEFLPLSHPRNKFIIDCNQDGKYSINFSDNYGFNNDNESWKNKIDYVFVGDSIGYGQCLNRKNNIPSIISKLNKINVLNLSMPANGLLLNYAILREYKKMFKNAKIILFINDTDFLDTSYELKDRILKKYLNDESFTQKIKDIDLSSIHNDIFDKRYKKLPFHNFLMLKKSRLFLKIKMSKGREKISIDNEARKKIDLIFQLISKQFIDSNITVIRLPLKDQYLDKNYNFQYLYYLEEIVKKYQFKYINTDEVFSNHENPFSLFSNKGHYNEKGYKKVSVYISKKLK
jgi:hypothetical protein